MNKNQKLMNEKRELMDEISNLNEFKNEVLDSKSWKITKPLRSLILIFKNR